MFLTEGSDWIQTGMSSPLSLFRVVVYGLLPMGFCSLPAAAQQQDWFSEDSVAALQQEFSMGRRPNSLLSLEYTRLLWDDVVYVFASPLGWEREDWQRAGLLGGTVGLASLLDTTVQSGSQRMRTLARDTFTEYAQRFGEEYSWMVLGGFELVGRLTNNPRARGVAMDGVSASVISAGLITPALKRMVGRARPHTAGSPFEFTAFSDQYSFPSGHATQAFAVATVIAEHYDSRWIKALSFGVAGAVGYSRIHQDRHYLSDVLAGALIGHFVGKTVVRRHDRLTDDKEWIWTPVASTEWTGLTLSRKF